MTLSTSIPAIVKILPASSLDAATISPPVSPYDELPSARYFKELVPLSKSTQALVAASRARIDDILNHRSDRFLVILGPCALHDLKLMRSIARQLVTVARSVGPKIEIVLRVNGEKPRSDPKAWKGYIDDPFQNGTHERVHGIAETRKLMRDIVEMGIPIATEVLNLSKVQSCLDDLVSYSWVGARSCEKAEYRAAAAKFESPVGIKHPCNGDLQAGVRTVAHAAGVHDRTPRTLVNPDEPRTGNKSAHLILRGSNSGPNYDTDSILTAAHLLREQGCLESVIIDANHGNSGKIAWRQRRIFSEVVAMRANGMNKIRGAMMEVSLRSGQTRRDKHRTAEGKPLAYGKSILDQCIGLRTAVVKIMEASLKLEKQ